MNKIEISVSNKNITSFFKTGGYAAILQLLILLIAIVVIGIYGLRPESALDNFEMFKDSKLIGLLRDDFLSLILIILYLFTFPALFVALMKHQFTLSFYATLLTIIGVILCTASHSGFSLMYLTDLYWNSTDVNTKLQFLAAGESIIAGNMWNTTASFFSGIFLQGSGVLISIAMIGSGKFSKYVIISGLIANGLDLLQHVMHVFTNNVPEIILWLAGPFYILWFLMLGIDLLKLPGKS